MPAASEKHKTRVVVEIAKDRMTAWIGPREVDDPQAATTRARLGPSGPREVGRLGAARSVAVSEALT